MRNFTILFILSYLVWVGCEATPWDGKVALTYTPEYYFEPSILYINDQFSHDYTNNSHTLAQIQRGGSSNVLHYDYIGKWIYSGGSLVGGSANPPYLIRTNEITSQKVYLPPNFGAGDWVLAVNENVIVYWVSYDGGPVQLHSVPMIGTNFTSDPILNNSVFNQTSSNNMPSYLAYDPVTSYIYAINRVGQLYRFFPNGSAFEYRANLQLQSPVSCDLFSVQHWLFAKNNSIIFNSACTSNAAYVFRYSVLEEQFHIIGSFAVVNYQYVILTAVDWESRILVSSLYNSTVYQEVTYSMNFDESFISTSPPVAIADYYVGPVIFFPPTQNASQIQELSACSFSGTLLNGACVCDESNYGPTCSQFCLVNVNCLDGTCGSNGTCICSPGYYYNTTHSACYLTAVPPLTPPEFFSSLLVFYRMLNETHPVDFYHSTQQSAEKYSSATNQNVFLLNNYRSGSQLQANGVACSSVPLFDQTFPLYFMPFDSLLINPNVTFEGISCQLWETPDGMVTTYTTTWLGSSVPVFVNNSFKLTETRFNLSTISFSFESYSWMVNEICSACENSPAQCVSSTHSFSPSPSRSSTRTRSPSATRSRSRSISESPSPSISVTSSISVSISPSASISPSFWIDPSDTSNFESSVIISSDGSEYAWLYITLAAGFVLLLILVVIVIFILFKFVVKRKKDSASYDPLQDLS